MTSIKLILTGARAWALVDGPLTSGMVGIPVIIECDETWNGLTKNLMCRCSPWNSNEGETRTILNVEDSSTVSHEVMRAGMYLHLGVEGFSDDGTLVIPTTWARCGKIEYGANTCEDLSADPELPIWNQLQTEVEQIKSDGYTQEQIDEIQVYVQSASQAATRAERAEGNSIAASNLSVSNANLAEIHAKQAQAAEEAAKTSAGSAANLANGALQAQRAAEAAAERAEAAADSGGKSSIRDALDGEVFVLAADNDSGGDEPGTTPDATLVGITAAYSGGSVPVGTAVSALTGVVVTATYSDGSTATVTGYTLSGSIAEGENTITVTYEGKTATFTVIGVAESGGGDSGDDDGGNVEIDIPADGLLAYYDMRTPLTTDNYITDLSGNGKHILFYPDKGYYADGTLYRGDKYSGGWGNITDGVSLTGGASGMDYGNAVTVLATIKNPVLSSTGSTPVCMLGNSEDYTNLTVFKSNLMVHQSAGWNKPESKTPLTANTIQTVAFSAVADGNENVYIDGVVKNTNPATNLNLGNTFYPLTGYGSAGDVNQAIYNIAIYNRELSADEVAAISATLLANAGGVTA